MYDEAICLPLLTLTRKVVTIEDPLLHHPKLLLLQNRPKCDTAVLNNAGCCIVAMWVRKIYISRKKNGSTYQPVSAVPHPDLD